MHNIFISHSSQNRDVAAVLKRTLEKEGFICWMAPDNILPGQAWEDAIALAIAEVSIFLLVWSAYSQNSEQVKRELSLAASLHRAIIPLRIELVKPNGAFAFYLTNTHWLDLDVDDIDAAIQANKSWLKSLLNSSDDTFDPEPWGVHYHKKAKEILLNTDPGTQPELLDAVSHVYLTAKEARLGHVRVIRIGIAEVAEHLEVKIPAGVRSGTRLRLKGKGHKSKITGQRGDLFLTVRIRND